MGVNALNRAHPISTVVEALVAEIQEIVLMPLGGLIPFLQRGVGCSREIKGCVNALGRAHPISTLFTTPWG